MVCGHTYLQLDPSPFAPLAGFEQPSARERQAAETKSGHSLRTFTNRTQPFFPGPLVLPFDDLNFDPDSSPQDYKEWISAETRNRMTDRKREVLYVARVPHIAKEMQFMRQWTIPNAIASYASETPSPRAELFVEYLQAFYHGLPVRLLPQQLTWTSWEKSTRPNRRVSLPKYVGLTDANKSMTRIRVRRVPDKAFGAQLNLDDILDTAIAVLPADAYALVLLVDHDIYESEDDDFCCGRAYGGSRVAVVQTARYNPVLDIKEGIDRAHMWPMSHCKTYVDELCSLEDVVAKKPTMEQKAWGKHGAMSAAVDAARRFTGFNDEDKEFQALWFARLARTVSHELGHCFGIAHCFYYACNMQGTAGMKEDVRQPPYLCPVCEAKVGHAIVEELRNDGENEKTTWIMQRCMALRAFCQKLDADGLSTPMWEGLAAWLEVRNG